MASTPEQKQVKVGEREFTIRRFTLRQLRDVLPLLDGIRGLPPTDPRAIDALAGVVAIAVRRDHPDVTVDTILDLEASMMDLVAVAREAALMSGMEVQELAPGEVKAGATTSR